MMNRILWPQTFRRTCATTVVAALASAAFTIAPVTLPGETSGSIAPVAHAAVTGFPVPADPTQIDMNKPVELTFVIPDIRSFEPPEPTKPPRGGVDGYTVTISQVKTDPINTVEGYTKAAKLDVAAAKALGLEESRSEISDSNGAVTFSGLKPGAYYITVTPPEDSSKRYAVPQEMIVVVPLVAQDGRWNYQPRVIAKFDPKDCECPPPTTTPPTPPTPPSTPGTTTPGTTPPEDPDDPEITMTTTPNPDPDSEVPPTSPGTGTPPGGGSSGGSGSLAVTGVQAAWLAGIAAMLIGAGALVLVANRKNENNT